jgi:hypothetical protein
MMPMDEKRRSPQAGDLGFATIAGHVGGWVNILQALLNDACRFTHVFEVVYPIGDKYYPDGLVQEAMPGGMRVRPLADRLTPGYAFATLDLTDAQRAMVPAVARSFMPSLGGVDGDERGPGYSWGTYLVLALAQYRITRWLTPGLQRMVDNRKRWICSQHADEFAIRLGLRLFTDLRWRGDVTPGDVYFRTDPRVIMPAPASVDGA